MTPCSSSSIDRTSRRLVDIRVQRTLEIVNEAARFNARTQEQVLGKIGLLQADVAELQADAGRYEAFARDHGMHLTAHG